jgi:type I restriction enzyme, S subunit
MSKRVENNKKVLVPKLRFPEFRKSKEWYIASLGAVCDMQAGKFIAASEISEKREAGFYPCFGGNGLRGYTKIYNHSGRYSLVGRQGALCGNVNIVEGDFYATEHAVVTTPKTKIRTDWLFYNLCLLNLNRFATGQAQPGLSIEVLDRVACVVPKEEKEQQKIADCLSSLDTLIAAHADKLKALKTHKKGLMQQLFPRDGEAVPRLRFAEFQDKGEWESNIIGGLVELLSGYAFKSEYFSEEGDKLLTPKNFTKNGFADFSNKNTKYTTEKCEQRYICKGGDLLLLLTDLTPTCELLGRPLLLAQSDGEVLLNQRIVKVIPKKKVEKSFLLYLFLTDSFRKRIVNTATGSTVRHSSNTIVSTTKIQLPSLPEQKKIADCLSSLDALIVAQAEKLDALKTHKKGLMRQLFPVVSEASA